MAKVLCEASGDGAPLELSPLKDFSCRKGWTEVDECGWVARVLDQPEFDHRYVVTIAFQLDL
jgi:hypothetical protein